MEMPLKNIHLPLPYRWLIHAHKHTHKTIRIENYRWIGLVMARACVCLSVCVNIFNKAVRQFSSLSFYSIFFLCTKHWSIVIYVNGRFRENPNNSDLIVKKEDFFTGRVSFLLHEINENSIKLDSQLKFHTFCESRFDFHLYIFYKYCVHIPIDALDFR